MSPEEKFDLLFSKLHEDYQHVVAKLERHHISSECTDIVVCGAASNALRSMATMSESVDNIDSMFFISDAHYNQICGYGGIPKIAYRGDPDKECLRFQHSPSARPIYLFMCTEMAKLGYIKARHQEQTLCLETKPSFL